MFAATACCPACWGRVELASYQMVMGWIAVPFVISLGLAEAAMVRVAYWVGADDAAAARQAGNLGMVIGVAIPLVLVAIPVFAPELVIASSSRPADPDYAEIASLVSVLLVIAAVFQVFDGLQAIASHALRGLEGCRHAAGHRRHRLLGHRLRRAYVMGFVFGWGAIGLWAGLGHRADFHRISCWPGASNCLARTGAVQFAE